MTPHCSRRFPRCLIAVAAILACGCGTSDKNPTGPIAVASITVSPVSMSLVAGESGSLSAQALSSGGIVLTGRGITWSSSNATVATVASSGLVTAVAGGGATITAAAEGIQGTMTVTVSAVPVASVTVSPLTVTLAVSGTEQLTATTRDAGGNVLTRRTVGWASSTPSVATVGGTGLVTAVAPGTAVIAALSEGQGGFMTVTVPPGLPAAKLLNVTDGDTLSYRMALLHGYRPTMPNSDVEVTANGVTRSWPLFGGYFKAFVLLQPGANDLILKYNNGKQERVTLHFKQPSAMEKQVRFFFFLGSDGLGTMDAPPGVPNGISETIKRMKFNAFMLQTFFAESFRASRLFHEGRAYSDPMEHKTFQFELDANLEPIIYILRSDLTQLNMWNRNDGGQDFFQVVRIVNSGTVPWNPANTVHFGRSGISHLDPSTGIYKAGVCAGSGGIEGGGVGMCEGANLITHARDIDDLVAAFSNNQAIDQRYIVDDSQGRMNYWGSFAASLGGLMHEGGHALSLGHSDVGVMASDFGSINRFFMVYELRSDGSKLPITPDNELRQGVRYPWWTKSDVGILLTSPYIY